MTDRTHEPAMPQHLIEEYKLCSSRADNYGTLIWQLVTILLTISVGGVAVVVQFDNHQVENYYSVFVLASTAYFLLRWWNQVANRWNAYIGVWYFRMKEIESEFHMWGNRYIDLLDISVAGKTGKLSEEEIQRTDMLREKGLVKDYATKSIQKLRIRLVFTVISAWIILLAREGVLTYTTLCNVGCDQQSVLLQLVSPFVLFVVFYLVVIFYEDRPSR